MQHPCKRPITALTQPAIAERDYGESPHELLSRIRFTTDVGGCGHPPPRLERHNASNPSPVPDVPPVVVAISGELDHRTRTFASHSLRDSSCRGDRLDR